MMNFARLLALGAGAWLFTLCGGCGGGVSLGSAPGALGAGDGDGADGNGGAAGPYDIACTFYFEPAGRKLEDTFNVRSDAQGSKKITFPGYTVQVGYDGVAGSTSESALSFAVPEYEVSQTLRLARDKQPAHEFIGDHGFTGLVYVGPSLQYICKVPDAQNSYTTATGPAKPIDVGCTVEVRTTPGGAVERSELIQFTGEDSRKIDLGGGFAIQAAFADDAAEGRGMWLNLWRDPNNESTPNVHQLFQFNRSGALPKGDFGGRVAISKSASREVSYSCASR